MEKYNETFANKIARASIQTFKRLGKNGKPRNSEYVFLSCIVKEEASSTGPSYNLEVVALGTGSKCMGESQQSPDGSVVMDSHAEIVARRAFKTYLLDQIEFALNGKGSIFEIGTKGCILKENIYFHFYSSHTPCGDASICPIELKNVIDSSKILSHECSISKKIKLCQESSAVDLNAGHSDQCFPIKEDVYRTGAKCVPGEEADSREKGLNYHAIGSLRVKPGRGNPTLSHSCSDKMFKWSILGLQGAIVMLFLCQPIYLETITVGGYTFNRNSLERALYTRFVERLSNLKLISPYKIVTPKILQSDTLFEYQRTVIRIEPSYTSLIWSKAAIHKNKHEVCIEGKRLGTTKKTANSIKSQVSICRFQLFSRALLLIKTINQKIENLPSLNSVGQILEESQIEKANDTESYNIGLLVIVKNLIGESLLPTENKVNYCEALNKKVDITYWELKDIALNYQQTWQALKRFVLVNWTKKNKCFKDFRVFQKC